MLINCGSKFIMYVIYNIYMIYIYKYEYNIVYELSVNRYEQKDCVIFATEVCFIAILFTELNLC